MAGDGDVGAPPPTTQAPPLARICAIGIVIQTPSYPCFALFDGLNLGWQLALHLTDTSCRHHYAQEHDYGREMAIKAENRRQFEIPEVKTETWPRIG
jgi:hypothetical protein